MAAVSVECSDFTVHPDGSVSVVFTDGTGLSIGSLDDLKMEVSRLETSETARLLMIGWFLARQPDASNVNLVEGKTLTFDLSAANAIRVQ